MIDRINVQAFIFTRKPDFKVLILKRIPKRSGYWQPVCGGIEDGEQETQAVKREIFEETGLEKIENIIDLKYSFVYEETKNGKLMSMKDICYAVEVNSVVDVKLSDEHEKFIWCSELEAKQYLTWEHNLIALRKLMEMI
ncbi:NUDIX domain-containing protein [Proteiniborus sp. MB09-C3]|uniref:NUDIX hydrolase n=1 Tax=Proteiniborus sp. MB09-C3 TaxID=3050072 RepID=UPI0025546C4A|nr:NUDIX domain-containing protein [Proteiniborus sp. MB09-C3]WIV12729.1 NUDIX domain-containing protein [Proteiniborus sp. MB09-C3]